MSNGAFILSTTFLKSYYFYFANFIIILTEPKTKEVDDLFKFSQSKVIISYCYFSFYGLYLYKILMIEACCHESYP